ncbi:VOC family protein [Sinomicrobium weinanense]|uniref:VOC family protein n=1 Tax=Sinomicrobium weinanense TaxID=2842200 RepID=A0A926JUM5_9FLAO|nr:VOC family protein [Sinomicrobium weinanense]MBC9797496.1 VOC family protein [Sinomicrobium weinanense]MBU3122218.1 VOC family protein [Sinomicrobium weinanense]
MQNKNETIRIVPNIYSNDMTDCKKFYVEFLGLKLVMDMEWIYTFASEKNPLAQISVIKNENIAPLDNSAVFISMEVSDVNNKYERAKQLGWDIVYDIRNEPWGVRRFFVKDPNGATINVLSHL